MFILHKNPFLRLKSSLSDWIEDIQTLECIWLLSDIKHNTKHLGQTAFNLQHGADKPADKAFYNLQQLHSWARDRREKPEQVRNTRRKSYSCCSLISKAEKNALLEITVTTLAEPALTGRAAEHLEVSEGSKRTKRPEWTSREPEVTSQSLCRDTEGCVLYLCHQSNKSHLPFPLVVIVYFVSIYRLKDNHVFYK